MNVSQLIVLVTLLIGHVLAQLAGGPAPRNDGDERLQGRWIERTNDLELNILFDQNNQIAIALSGSGPEGKFARTGVGQITDVGEDGRGPFFTLAPSVAHASGLPQRIDYRFEDDALILEMTEGVIQGQHELVREEKANGFRNKRLMIGGVLIAALVVVVLLVAMTQFLKPRKKTAED